MDLHRANPILRDAVLFATCTSAYIVAAQVGLHFSTLPGNVTTVWPPAGIVLAFLLRFGIRFWPAIAVGSLIVDLYEGLPWPIILAVALANTGTAVIGAWLVLKVAPSARNALDLRGFLAILGLGGAAATVFGASVGVGALALRGLAGPAVIEVWLYWWLADVIGVFVLTPALIAWCMPSARAVVRSRIAEAGALAAATVVASMLIFFGPASVAFAPASYMAVPILVWGALRLGVIGATSSFVVVASLAIVGTTMGLGPFATTAVNTSIVRLYSFLAATGATAILLGIHVDGRQTALYRSHKSENRLRALFEQDVFGLALVSPTGIVQEANGAFLRLTGLDPQKAGGPSIISFLAPRDRANMRAAIDSMAAGHQQRAVLDVFVRRMDAQFEEMPQDVFDPPAVDEPEPLPGETWCRVMLAYIPDPGDGAPHLLAIFEDITEQRRAAQAHRIAQERLHEISKLEEIGAWKSRLIDVASHEIKTPLTPIKLQLHMLSHGRMGQLSQQQKHALEIVDREVNRLNRLVRKVLDVSRIERGRLELERQPADLNQIVRQAAASFQAPAAIWGIDLVVDGSGPVMVNIDADRIEQVVVNLLSNAFKFSSDGAQVQVRVWQEGDDTFVSVSDQGPGLRSQDLLVVFEAFAKVREYARAREDGSGLGLAICKGIIQAHGGRIWAESAGLGRGTTFCFLIPQKGGTGFIRPVDLFGDRSSSDHVDPEPNLKPVPGPPRGRATPKR